MRLAKSCRFVKSINIREQYKYRKMNLLHTYASLRLNGIKSITYIFMPEVRLIFNLVVAL